jgi:hypothetical protein
VGEIDGIHGYSPIVICSIQASIPFCTLSLTL